jgi:integrase/recombinase XerC
MSIDNFFNYLEYEKRSSKHTIKAYRKDIDQFSNYVTGIYQITDLLQVNSIHIRSWLAGLHSEGIAPLSIKRKLSAINSYYKFCFRKGYIDKIVSTGISAPKSAKKLPAFLRQGQSEKLMELLPEVEDFKSARERLIIELLYTTGIRRSELIGLQMADVHINERKLKVLGKRSKERLIPMAGDLCVTMRSYLEYRNEVYPDQKELLLTDKGNTLYPRYVYDLVVRFLSLVTTSDKKGPHTLRHTFATQLLDNGADLNAIKELLGHADLSATQVYTHTSIEQMKKTYEKAHPKAKKSNSNKIDT